MHLRLNIASQRVPSLCHGNITTATSDKVAHGFKGPNNAATLATAYFTAYVPTQKNSGEMPRRSYFLVADHQIISFMSLVGLKSSSNTFRLWLHLKELWCFIVAILFCNRRKDLSILAIRPSSVTPPVLYRISNLEHNSRDGPVSSLPSLYVLQAKSITHKGTPCASEAAQLVDFHKITRKRLCKQCSVH